MQPRDAAATTRAPTAVDRSVGERIRRLRLGSGRTLRGLGHMIGVSAVQLQRYETGASRVAASRLVAIAQALAVSVEALVGDPPATHGRSEPIGRGRDVVELVRMFRAIRDPAQRAAILAFVRAIAPAVEAPPTPRAPVAMRLPPPMPTIAAESP